MYVILKKVLHLAISFSDALDKMSVDGASGEPTEELFECVICGQTSPSTEGRPIGLVALLQPSAGDAAYSETFFSKNLLKTTGYKNANKKSECEGDGSLERIQFP